MGDMEAVKTSPPARQAAAPSVLAACLAAVGIALLLVGGVVLIVPNSAHVDVPNVGTGIFFDCGGALYPGSRPAEEPGITACAEINDSMLRSGLLLTIGGAATTLAGISVYWLLRRRAM